MHKRRRMFRTYGIEQFAHGGGGEDAAVEQAVRQQPRHERHEHLPHVRHGRQRARLLQGMNTCACTLLNETRKTY